MKPLSLLIALCVTSSVWGIWKKDHGTGLKIPSGWDSLASFESPELPTEGAPWFFDWRDQVTAEKQPVIRNQGGCGSCWAFGTTAILNWAVSIYKNERVTLAEQEILSCSSSGSCRGGYFAHAYQKNPGHGLDTEFPYTARDLRCKAGLSHKYKIKSWGYVGEKNRRPTAMEIKAAIMKYGAVASTVTANGSMMSFRGPGVFKGCSRGSTNHIVHIVGWNDSIENGVWIMGNSWGANWGDHGYAKVPYGCSNLGEIVTWIDLE